MIRGHPDPAAEEHLPRNCVAGYDPTLPPIGSTVHLEWSVDGIYDPTTTAAKKERELLNAPGEQILSWMFQDREAGEGREAGIVLVPVMKTQGGWQEFAGSTGKEDILLHIHTHWAFTE